MTNGRWHQIPYVGGSLDGQFLWTDVSKPIHEYIHCHQHEWWASVKEVYFILKNDNLTGWIALFQRSEDRPNALWDKAKEAKHKNDPSAPETKTVRRLSWAKQIMAEKTKQRAGSAKQAKATKAEWNNEKKSGKPRRKARRE